MAKTGSFLNSLYDSGRGLAKKAVLFGAGLTMLSNVANSQDVNLTLEGRILNLANEPKAGVTVTVNDKDNTTVVTDSNGYFYAHLDDFPVSANLNEYQRSQLDVGPVKREVFDLTGRMISSDNAYLNNFGEIENLRENIAGLKNGQMYLQRLTDKDGDFVAFKFFADSYRNISKAVLENKIEEHNLKSGQMGAMGEEETFGYKITLQCPDGSFRDTTLNVEDFYKGMTSHDADYKVNEFVKISDIYSAGLDTIINEPIAAFEITDLFSDDNHQNLEFEISEEYKNFITLDNGKLLLDRTKAPKKGSFGIKAIDPNNNATDELLISYNENAIEYTRVMLDEFKNPLVGESVDFSNKDGSRIWTIPIADDGRATLYTRSGEVYTRLPVNENRNWGLIFKDYVSESKLDTLIAANNDFNAPMWNELFLGMYENQNASSGHYRIPWDKTLGKKFYAFTRDVDGNDVKAGVDKAIADLKDRITFTTEKDFYKKMDIEYIDDIISPTYASTLRNGVAIYIHEEAAGDATVSAKKIDTEQGKVITLGIISYTPRTINNNSILERANGQEGLSISEGALGLPSGNFSNSTSSIYDEKTDLLEPSTMDIRMNNYAARKQMDYTRFIGNDSKGYYINTTLNDTNPFIQKANELKK